VFNKATCFGLVGHYEANTLNTRRKREIQKYNMPSLLENGMSVLQTIIHVYITGMCHITTFRLTTDRIYDGGPIRL